MTRKEVFLKGCEVRQGLIRREGREGAVEGGRKRKRERERERE